MMLNPGVSVVILEGFSHKNPHTPEEVAYKEEDQHKEA
jgi:hypothetical protein